jgi:hypothetical protein
MPRLIVRYLWRYYDPIRKRTMTTRYYATEEEIRPRHPDAVAVEHTRQEMEVSDDILRGSFSPFGRPGK